MFYRVRKKTPAGGIVYHHCDRRIIIQYKDYYKEYLVPVNKPLYAGCGKLVKVVSGNMEDENEA